MTVKSDKNILQESNYNRTVRWRLFHLDSLFFPEEQERGERQRRFCSLHWSSTTEIMEVCRPAAVCRKPVDDLNDKLTAVFIRGRLPGLWAPVAGSGAGAFLGEQAAQPAAVPGSLPRSEADWPVEAKRQTRRPGLAYSLFSILLSDLGRGWYCWRPRWDRSAQSESSSWNPSGPAKDDLGRQKWPWR